MIDFKCAYIKKKKEKKKKVTIALMTLKYTSKYITSHLSIKQSANMKANTSMQIGT